MVGVIELADWKLKMGEIEEAIVISNDLELSNSNDVSANSTQTLWCDNFKAVFGVMQLQC